jgi:hypothetical protein
MPLHLFCLNVCCSFKKSSKVQSLRNHLKLFSSQSPFPPFSPTQRRPASFPPVFLSFPRPAQLPAHAGAASPLHLSPLSLTDKRAPPAGASPTSGRLLSSPWPSRSSPAVPALSPCLRPFPSPLIAALNALAPPPHLFLSRTASAPPPSTNGAPPPEHTPPPRPSPSLPPPPYKS